MRKDTPQEATKKNTQWIGSFQIIVIIGDDVYKIQNPLGKMYEIHSSCL